MTSESRADPGAGGAGDLLKALMPRMEEMTWDRIGGIGLENAELNREYFKEGHSLATLHERGLGGGDSAVVIAAGPSIKTRDPGRALLEAGYKGTVLITESAIRYCLSNGLIPDLIVTIDPRPRIRRWFGIPDLTKEIVEAEGYRGREDLDAAFANQLKANAELLELTERHGAGLAIALATTSNTGLVKRALEVGMVPYWFNPMFDDPDRPDSKTRALQKANGMPSINGGGNVGATCWMLADAVLGKKHVALTGMDYSYHAGTPPEITQYYAEMVDLVGVDELASLFIDIENPHDGETYFTDPAYKWYRDIFLEMAADADCRTYNCTEGGILFGDHVEFIPLAEFLARHG